MIYRAEVDGLRAIAVIPVMLFHGNFPLFSGGFVGVDVFFVISGYLITSIIWSDLQQEKFSIVTFYERRARRILPALFLVVVSCIPFAAAWFTHRDMHDFAQSVMAVSTFSSNILFWIESGYFDTAAELKPLLHTWSLAVEEQFYIVYPLVLIVGWRLKRKYLIGFLATVFVCSLAAAHLLPIFLSHPKVASGVFYLAPTRAWELMLGAFVALYLNSYGQPKLPASLRDVFGLLGLGLILYSVFAFDESTPFPGLHATVPTVGTALILLFAFKDTNTARILSFRALVGIGLISYSAYLWHQPVLAFAKYRTLNTPSESVVLVLLGISILLAYLSWKYVEVPFRKRSLLSRDFVFRTSAVCIAALFSLGMVVQQQSAQAAYAGDGLRGGEGVLSDETQILLYGDSHARQYYRALEERYDNVKMITGAGCLSLPGIINEFNSRMATCVEAIDLLKKAMSEGSSDLTLVLAYRWQPKKLVELPSYKILGTPDDLQVRRRITSALTELITDVAQGKRVIIIGNVPSAHVASDYMREGYDRCQAIISSVCPSEYPINMGEGLTINAELADLSERYEQVAFLNPYDGLCDGSKCFVVSDDELLYSDHSHLTKAGAEKVIDILPAIFPHRPLK
jgi:peptidoglycan/LPS O-acetylase OafA/YrhL